MIDEKKLIDKLRFLEGKHRDISEKLAEFKEDNKYQEGYADGIRQAMNEIVGLLDEE